MFVDYEYFNMKYYKLYMLQIFFLANAEEKYHY